MKKILLMEDMPAHALDLIQQMEAMSYDVSWARDANEALAFLDEKQFDAVVADILIREGADLTTNGGIRLIGKIRAAARRIKAGNVMRPLPVIAISGRFRTDGKQDFLASTAMGVGADAALPKPVDMNRLRDLIETLTAAP